MRNGFQDVLYVEMERNCYRVPRQRIKGDSYRISTEMWAWITLPETSMALENQRLEEDTVGFFHGRTFSFTSQGWIKPLTLVIL